MTVYLNIVPIPRVIYPFVQIVKSYDAINRATLSAPIDPSLCSLVLAARKDPPDFYSIILDACARQDVWAERFGFDIQPLLDELERRGILNAEWPNVIIGGGEFHSNPPNIYSYNTERDGEFLFVKV